MKKILQHLRSDWYKYVIELFVITAGILGAYALNNWNENRKDREREQAILGQLQTEFRSNLKQLDERIAIRDRMKLAAFQILSYIDDPMMRDVDSINMHLAWTFPYTTFDPIVNDLASTGSLRIIQSDLLKQMLSFWTSEIVQVKEGEEIWRKYRNEIYVPFVIKHYQIRSMRNLARKTDLMQSFLIDKTENKETTNLGESNHQTDFNLLLDQPDYEDHLVRLITNNRVTQQQSFILRERIIAILDLLESELNK